MLGVSPRLMVMEITTGESLEDLVQRFGGHGNLKLDLGSGFYTPIGFIGIDNLEGAGSQIQSSNLPQVILDINRLPLPFEDGCASIVRTSHFLEHSNLDHVFSESHRVLKEGGVFDNTFPYAFSAEGLYPGHAIFLTEQWFRENLHFNDLFVIEDLTFVKHEYYRSWSPLARMVLPFRFARKHMMNICKEVRLVARKKSRKDS